MRASKIVGLLIVAGAMIGATIATVQAATITSVGATSFPPASTGTIGPVGATPSPNNDNATDPSANIVPYSIFFNSLGTLDVEFVAVNSGGTTEYRFTQFLVNNTGQTWTDFHLELGFGLGDEFVRSSLSDLLDFDTPDIDPVATSSSFATLIHQPETLDWSDGSVPAVSSTAFTFAIDLPDELQAFNPSGLNRFTLRQRPSVDAVVPEPATLLLFGFGLAGLVAFQCRSSRTVRESRHL